jgi:hypothetical protein
MSAQQLHCDDGNENADDLQQRSGREHSIEERHNATFSAGDTMDTLPMPNSTGASRYRVAILNSRTFWAEKLSDITANRAWQSEEWVSRTKALTA